VISIQFWALEKINLPKVDLFRSTYINVWQLLEMVIGISTSPIVANNVNM
jgi:hypothetical protein